MKYVISIKNEAIAEVNDYELAKRIAKMEYNGKDLIWIEERKDYKTILANYGSWGLDEILKIGSE